MISTQLRIALLILCDLCYFSLAWNLTRWWKYGWIGIYAWLAGLTVIGVFIGFYTIKTLRSIRRIELMEAEFEVIRKLRLKIDENERSIREAKRLLKEDESTRNEMEKAIRNEKAEN